MSPFTRAYYAAKPFLPRWLRMRLRRLHARRARNHSRHYWPIQAGSERPPAGWPGWPDGKKFAVVLTHDVEGPKGYGRIKELARVEQELGFRSSFNLIPEGPYRVEPELRQWLTDQGFEVGLHDLHHDGKLYRSRAEFSRHARKINRYVQEWGVAGFRSAYMHHNLEWLGDLDVAYDASTFDTDPFEPQPDGVGTIFPFWVPKQSSSSSSSSSSSNGSSPLSAPPLRAGERAGVRCSQSDLHPPQPCRDGAPSEVGLAAPEHPSEGGSSDLRNPSLNPNSRPASPSLGSSPLSAFSSPLLKRSPHSALPAGSQLSTTNSQLLAASPSPLSAFNSPLSNDASQLSTTNSQLETGASAGFVELPYTLVQDSTLFLFLGETTIDCWKRKLDWIAEHGGMVLLNVHPDYLSYEDRHTEDEYPARLYREFLAYLRDRYAGEYWHALPREAAAHVQAARPVAPVVQSEVDIATERVARAPAAGRDLTGRRAAVVLYSEYPHDPRPRRAAEALASAGMEVEVLCLQGKASDPETELINGVRVRRVPLSHSREGFVRYLFQYSAFFCYAAAFLARNTLRRKYDLVHVHNMPDFLAFSALPARLGGARVILDLHDPMPELYQAIYGFSGDHWMVSLLKEIERQSIRSADRVLTPNLAFQRIFESRSCAPGKMEIVMNSPEETIFRDDTPAAVLPPPPVGGQPFRVLHHGSIVHRHGLDIAIEALAIARRELPALQFFICGRPTPFLDEVLALAATRGLGEVVHFLGPKTQPEVAALVAACDLGVIPNRLSPFTSVNMPTRIFEYLAMNRPVIAPVTEGIRDYFDDGNLIFFEPDNPADLARHIVWVARNPAAAATVVKQGQLVYQEQVWARQREHFLNLVEVLLTPA
jgi:glycosyltransferase involved in cell wall biosynthesis